MGKELDKIRIGNKKIGFHHIKKIGYIPIWLPEKKVLFHKYKDKEYLIAHKTKVKYGKRIAKLIPVYV